MSTDRTRKAASDAPEALVDADLDVPGGVYVQEVPSGVVTPNARNAVLFFDEADAVKQPTARKTVFEPNDEP